ncbi:hypothetical protein BJ980_003477 [Nocardioides daedukensis]|uniref:Uncharacterized protein n=1 Tax=Nocardioides daedukensis TaxID=634462 RepID=A0A7Y9UUC7_9ACTN|nr:hypothetical protein [Nocardioides daedukensis]NYG60554.1 hypothetical protein [Nocardioides daedukensis]
MIDSPEDRSPAPLTVAASLAAVQALVLLGYGILELTNTSTERLAMGLTSALFFVLYGLALGWGAWLLSRGSSGARSPIVLTQLILLGVAWSFRGGETTMVAIVVAAVAVVVLAGIFHPASIERLDERAAMDD